jgi:hypothetical protein
LEDDSSLYLDCLKATVANLDTSVLGLLVQKQEDSWYTVVSFPDHTHSLSDLGKTYYSKKLSPILDDILKETENETQGN